MCSSASPTAYVSYEANAKRLFWKWHTRIIVSLSGYLNIWLNYARFVFARTNVWCRNFSIILVKMVSGLCEVSGCRFKPISAYHKYNWK